MFHAVGLTPEAPDLATALGGAEPAETVEVSRPDLDVTLAQLSTADEGAPLAAVSLGTPHFSFAEFEELVRLLDGFKPAQGVDLYVNTSRQTYGRLVETGLIATLKQARFTVVVDTCTYVTTIMRDYAGAVMTNSGKWAHYAPGNLGIDVAFGTLVDCLNSAARGRVTRRRP
jgi:predicted aconitase